MNPEQLESLLRDHALNACTAPDPAHDRWHFERVVRTAKTLCLAEHARLEIVVPAAWLHDLVQFPKNDPRRVESSTLSALSARELLVGYGVNSETIEDICHAIEAHSFSAGIEPRSLEAKIVQDADRLDALGAIGIARCFATGGQLGRPLYAEHDPFCIQRQPDDHSFTLDHFAAKLLRLVRSLHTRAAREEGKRRMRIMNTFLGNLEREIS